MSGAELVLVVVCLLGTLIGVVVSYRHSWDIVKFLHTAALAGALLLAWQTLTSSSRALRVVVAVGSVVGVVWLLRLGPLNGVVASSYVGGTDRQVALGQAFLASFGDVVPGRDCVFTPATAISSVGVLAPGASPADNAFILRDQERWQRRHAQWSAVLESPELRGLEAFGCPWAFLPDALLPAASTLTPVGTALVIDGEPWRLHRVPLTMTVTPTVTSTP